MQNRPNPSHGESREACEAFRERAELFAAEELTPEERAEMETHLRECGACAALLEEERRFLQAISSAPRAEADAHLLAQCRAGLSDELDRQEASKPWQWLRLLLGSRAFGFRAAVTAALLLMVGFLAGRTAPLQRFFPAAPVANSAHSGAAPPAAIPAADSELRDADVAGISWTPEADGAPPHVQVHLNEQRPFVVQGTVNNDGVKDVLLSVLQNGSRYSPDVRMESVDLLRPRSADEDVSRAMCRLLETDRNTAVRLRVIETLRDAPPCPAIQNALLQALRDDPNPGVRVEAVNSLTLLLEHGLAFSQPSAIAALRDRMQRDPNSYVRLQSAALVRDISASQGH